MLSSNSLSSDKTHSHEDLNPSDSLNKAIAVWAGQIFDMSQFEELVDDATSNDIFKQHHGTIGLRKLLGAGPQSPIQEVIDAGMIPKLIEYVKNEDYPHLQAEAAWALTNLASGTTSQTQAIVDKGGIPCFIQLLKSSNMKILEFTVWIIGNISGDSPVFRDMILRCGGLAPLLGIVKNASDNILIKDGTWAISNLCRGKPPPDLKLVQAAIPVLCQVLKKETAPEALTDAAWALSYSGRSLIPCRAIIASGVVSDLVSNLTHFHLQLIVPCIRILGNLLGLEVEESNAVLREKDFLPNIFSLTQHAKKAIRREAFWAISNVLAGTSEHIGLVLKSQAYFTLILNNTMKDIDEVKRESAWCVANATKRGTPSQISLMVKYGVLDNLIALLDSKDEKILEVALEGINNILNSGASEAVQNNNSENEFINALENKGGVSKIEELQSHPNTDIYLKALRILETHFDLEDV